MSSCPSHPIIQDIVLEAQEKVNQVRAMLMDPIADKMLQDTMLQDVLQKLCTISAVVDSGKAMSGSFREGSVCSDDRKSDQNSFGKRKFDHVPEIDQKRGVASRRRSQPSSSNRVIIKNLDDGHTWRKYGQKDIQGSIHPKSYFRCTHKFDQGCIATRHVQPTDEDPCTYNVAYIGEHTCQDPSTFHQFIGTPDPLQTDNSFLINFGSPNTLKFIKKETPHVISIKTSSIPPSSGNSHEDVFSTTLTPESSPVDQDFMPGNELAAIVGPASQAFSVYDQGEMISSLHSSPRSLDLEFMPSSIFGLDHDVEYSLFGFDNEDGDFLPRL